MKKTRIGLLIIIFLSAICLSLATESSNKIKYAENRKFTEAEFQELDKISSNKYVKSILIYNDIISIETYEGLCSSDCSTIEKSILNDNTNIVSEIIFN